MEPNQPANQNSSCCQDNEGRRCDKPGRRRSPRWELWRGRACSSAGRLRGGATEANTWSQVCWSRTRRSFITSYYTLLGGGVIVRRRSQKDHFQVETATTRQVLYHVTLVPVPVLLVVYASIS